MDEHIRLSIVIPTYNGWELLRRCLETVMGHRPADSEVIVVDDGSTDGTSRLLRSVWPDVRVVRLEKNAGFCRAANAGLAVSRGPIVELLNNDTEVTAGWAEPALRAFADPKVAAVAPLVCKLPFRERIDSAGDVYYWFGMAKKRGEGRPVEPPFDREAEVFGASASSAFYRRSAVEEVGGFPEHFGAYLDDVDLGFRLRLAGGRCLFVPASRVYHWVSRSHRLASRKMKSQVARNSERVFWINVPRRLLLMMAAPHIFFLLLQLAYKASRGDFGPWFAGKCALLTEFPELLRRRRLAQSFMRNEVASLPPQSHDKAG